MKCLLCSSKFENQNDLLNHDITYHNIDENYWFFQKLFQIKDKAILRQCIRSVKVLDNDAEAVV